MPLVSASRQHLTWKLSSWCGVSPVFPLYFSPFTQFGMVFFSLFQSLPNPGGIRFEFCSCEFLKIQRSIRGIRLCIITSPINCHVCTPPLLFLPAHIWWPHCCNALAKCSHVSSTIAVKLSHCQRAAGSVRTCTKNFVYHSLSFSFSCAVALKTNSLLLFMWLTMFPFHIPTARIFCFLTTF